MRWLALLAPALVLTSPVDVLTGTVDTAATDVDAPEAKCLTSDGWYRRYWDVDIPAIGQERQAKVCEVLWRELKNGGGLLCVVSSPHGCELLKGKGNEETLDWHFHTSKLCKAPIVEIAIARATNFHYEHVQCKDA